MMIRPVEGFGTRGLCRFVEAEIARYQHAVADRRERAGVAERTVQVDDEPRVTAEDPSPAEPFDQLHGDGGRTDIPGDMVEQMPFVETETPERGGDSVRCMVADEHDLTAVRPGRAGADDGERGRLTRADQGRRIDGGGHGHSVHDGRSLAPPGA